MSALPDQIATLEADHLTWRLALFEKYLTNKAGEQVPDGPHHRHFWTWVWSIEPGIRPRPFVGVWARGGAKSTNAEEATVALGARGIRRYGWYISGTQDQADDHVSTIGGMLESETVATFYPDLARRKVSKYGSSKGWRRQRLRTASGFTIDAVGLDKDYRGVKMDEDRPDFMVFDDVDDKYDSAATVKKKIGTITSTLMPAGSEDCVRLFIQNLIHPDSIFSQLVDGRAEFLANKILSGPIPAVEDLTYERKQGRTVITGGQATWVGQPLSRSQSDIDEFGISAFLEEGQHEVEAPPGGMFDHLELEALRVQPDDVPTLTRVVCWVDPAVTKSDSSDSHGIQIDGIDGDARTGTIYRLYSWEKRATPLVALTKALRMAAVYGARYVGVETDQGGDTWQSVFREAKTLAAAQAITAKETDEVVERIRNMRFAEVKAGQGDQPKTERAARMLVDYELPGLRVRHVIGTHVTLERALRRFPKTKPLDLVDCGFYSWTDLRNAPEIAAANMDDQEPPEVDPYAAERISRVW